MATDKLDDLILNASENPTKSSLETLALFIQNGNIISSADAEKFSMLWEALQATTLTPEIARLVSVFASKCEAEPGAVFRKLLCDSTRMMLPRDMGHAPVMRALGARNDKMPVKTISERLERLFALKCGMVVFLPGTGRWGAVSTIDSVNGTVVLGAFRGNGNMITVPLEALLGEALVFAADGELSRVMEPSLAPLPSSVFRDIIRRRAKLPVSEMQMRAIALSGCARKLSEVAFNAWWSATTTTASQSAQRRSCEGRSITEMLQLLTAEEADPKDFTDDAYPLFKSFFQRVRVESITREAKNMAMILSMIFSRADAEKFADCVSPLLGKVCFLPVDPDRVALNDLAVWGELSAKALTSLGEAVVVMRGKEYFNRLVVRLPLKALNSVSVFIDTKELARVISEKHYCSADLLCWVWKNPKRAGMEALNTLLNIENVIRVLSAGDLPKAWGAAFRELRGNLMDKEDFQKWLIDQADGDAKMFTSTLCGALFLSASERQSLLVKLSRVSTALQGHLEAGAAKQVLSAGIGKKQQTISAPAADDGFFSSSKSKNRLIKEYEDIVNVQIPENREALKTARAHGDFRENSEFDAAKERRNQLSRRRNELERDIATTQVMMMSNIAVTDICVIGSTVEIEYSDGEKSTCYLLGAWDGDPDRHMLSYRSRLGAALLNRKVGEKVEFGDRTCTITKVAALPAELARELDE